MLAMCEHFVVFIFRFLKTTLSLGDHLTNTLHAAN